LISLSAPDLVFLSLIPLGFLAGLDLYLTLLLLGVAAQAGWGVLPGNLGDLGAPPLLAMSVGFYLVELAAERPGPVSLFWNSAHAPIRMLGASLLLVMAVPDAPGLLHLVGGILAALLAGVAHGGRFGTRQLLRLAAARPPSFALVSFAEDGVVLLLGALTLAFPTVGATVTVGLVVLILTVGRPAIRASLFGIRLAWGVWASLLSDRRWRTPADFPRWVRRAGGGDRLAPGGILRGSPAAGWRIPSGGPFRTGWIVITGSGPFFLHRGFTGVRTTSLAGARVRRVSGHAVFQRVELEDSDGHPFALLLARDGPAADLLRGEFRSERKRESTTEPIGGGAD